MEYYIWRELRPKTVLNTYGTTQRQIFKAKLLG
jgi:hypothetical protein